jgi:hypothetical protein
MTAPPATTPAGRVTPLRLTPIRQRLVVLAVLAVLLAVYTAVFNSPAARADTPLSQGKPATASSTQNAGTPASAAFDGDNTTRWSSSFSDPQWLTVDLGSDRQIGQVQLRWEAAYASAFEIQISSDATTWTDLYSTTTGTGGNQTLQLRGFGRYVRMLGTARATGYGYSLYEFQVYAGAVLDPGICQTVNIALNRTATASSTQSGGTPAAAAVDGNLATRWSSAFSDPQWLKIDLGSSQNLCKLTLNWEAAYAKAFQLQVSNDGTSWTTVYYTSTGTGGNYGVYIANSARYVRMNGTARGTQYGYSVWEFGVYPWITTP